MLLGSVKPTQADIKQYDKRLWLIRLAICLGMLILGARMVWLQIFEHEHYSSLSSNNRIKSQFVTPVRGKILDRDGQILATNRAAFGLEILPNAVEDLASLIAQIRQSIEISPEEERLFYQRLDKSLTSELETVLLKDDLSAAQAAIILAQLFRLQGVSVHSYLRRYYPYGEDVSTFIGHMGRIDPQEFATQPRGLYSRNGYIGKLGLEYKYQDILYGMPGRRYVEVDAHGRIHRELDRDPAAPGMDLYTSISLRLQSKARDLMRDRKGAVVALQPFTGEVLALYSAPSYDNNTHIAKIIDQIKASNLYNRAISGIYPPASTIKAYYALMAKSAAATDEDTNAEAGAEVEPLLKCPGYYRVGRRIFRDWKRAGHGEVDLVQALAQSCDVYFYHLATQLGSEPLLEILSQFGFGQVTGIDLPNEAQALLPSPEWKLRTQKEVWWPGDTVNLGIGQGYLLATPLQMAVAISALANGGQIITPQLWRGQKESASESMAEQFDAPEPIVARKIEDVYLERLPEVIAGLHEVVFGEKGTARNIARKFNKLEIEMAGKTGTAQVIRLRTDDEPERDESDEFADHALFVGYAPLDKPEIAVVVVVENVGNGSKFAAPIAADLMIEWLTRPNAELSLNSSTP